MLSFNRPLINLLFSFWIFYLASLSVSAATELPTFIKTASNSSLTAANPINLTIGTVATLEGQGWIIHSDETRDKIAVGLSLKQGDSIHTSPQSTAEVKFLDGSSVTVKPSSQVNIEQYRWDAKNKTGFSVLEFIKGTFRALSGLIAKDNPDNYEFKTPVATIGVRGTDFGARYCEHHTCVTQIGENSLTLSQGVYMGVLDGQIVIRANNTETLVDAGQAVFQKDADSPALPVQNLPGLIFSAAELKTYTSEVKVPFYDAFLVDSSGNPLKDNFGNCIRSSLYRSDHFVTECR